jgi:hypothetical protein
MPKTITLSEEHIEFMLSKCIEEILPALNSNGYIVKAERNKLRNLLRSILAQLHGIPETEVYKLLTPPSPPSGSRIGVENYAHKNPLGE